MFGKKPDSSLEQSLPNINVQTIPADFYGGVNPVVKFKKVEKEVLLDSKPKLTPAEKKILDKITSAGNDQPLHAVNILANKKYAIILGFVLFIVISAVVGGYYYLQMRNSNTGTTPTAPEITIPVTVPETTETPPVTTEVPTTTDSAPKFLADAPIEFPSNLLGDSVDLDKDDISDMAEELFGSDPSKPDTDEDGYEDGHEVFYLYNPAGKEPMRIIESGYVKEYQNPTFGYKLFYPTDWAVGAVDDTARDVLFSTITGENIEVRTFDLPANQTFADWFREWAPNQNFQNNINVQTKFFEAGKSRADSLVYYFADSAHVYAIIYHTTDSNTVNFRSIIVMMARSFRTAGFVPPETAPDTSAFPTEMPESINQ
ncbi:MAG: hypothetical protein A2534_04860 [Candidatus Magasanikbacteria bacterium RIFOXYD2_FULL_39_9]|uniref:Uncharacterized protein n=1 Tax=Candidatus Magasanikbacteria bacterium RIFOXYD1_FULL_40_23 TaxID=1798705 RepID=A0A1F6P864_9BACT|nr:MAG: hypothetical protein A2534_04860 [Candidatus Magasanikbacteria bacterium RIFOXYD2_FULL_39_9]OGH92371.1 MAG: hypothetical protein A2563_05330 [Candidatus Magasanikbacteria bacterium RIFOXYD1_FULL_40_23]